MFISFPLEEASLSKMNELALSLTKRGLCIVIDGDKKVARIEKEEERRADNDV